MSDDVDNWFLGNSAPSLSFLELGTTYEGQITHKAMMQARDIQTGKPKFWDDGNPVMQAVITLQTNLRDPEVENDDGMRRLYVGSMGMKTAIATAIKQAHASGLQVGGTLKIRYVKDGEATKRGFNPPKEYQARYEPPTAVDDFFGDEGGAPYQETEDLSAYGEEPF